MQQLAESGDAYTAEPWFSLDGKVAAGLNALGCGRSEYDSMCSVVFSRSIGVYPSSGPFQRYV
jgi:hypothetical protein